MAGKRDLTGEKFGKLKVVKRGKGKKYGNQKYAKSTWICECECTPGSYIEVMGNSLVSGLTTSCGCVRKEKAKESIFQYNGIEHNMKNTRLYQIWTDMKRRCNGTKESSSEYYYNKNIKVCKEWNGKGKSFLNFYNWAINNGYRDDLTIDRIDTNGDYKPDNCRWTTYEVQSINQVIRKDNKSGYKGVHWDKGRDMWKARIGVNNQDIVLGYFTDIKDAIAARKRAEEKYHKPLLENPELALSISSN